MKPEDILTEYMQLRPDAPVPEDPMVLIQSLFGIIYALQAEVAELRARLSKDSHNSSKPPSSDGLEKKPVSLRKACGRKPGGQKGHAGHTLEFVLPNTVIEHSPPDYCDACGASLGGCEASLSNVDRSLISRRSSWGGEHRVSAVTCTCGKVHRGAFPTDVSAPVHYGPSLKAASVYPTQWQLLPVRRSTDVLGHLFGMPVSPATVIGAIAQVSLLLTPAGEVIKQGILDSKVVCFDESGPRVNGRLNWLHSAGTTNLTW